VTKCGLRCLRRACQPDKYLRGLKRRALPPMAAGEARERTEVVRALEAATMRTGIAEAIAAMLIVGSGLTGVEIEKCEGSAL